MVDTSMDTADQQASNSTTSHVVPCLVLAPHLNYPLRNGADILIHNRWSAFSHYVPYVDIVGQRTVQRYIDGELRWSKAYTNAVRSKNRAAFRTILYRSQYLREKFITKEFVEQASVFMAEPAYRWVVGSFLYTMPLLTKDPHREGRIHLVETHNDDMKWYRTLGHSARNPLAKLVADFSMRWTARAFRSYHHHLLFLHLTEADREGFLNIVTDHRSVLAPIGVTIPDAAPKAQTKKNGIRLLFVGSLGVKMNKDALDHFTNRYFPALKQNLGPSLRMDIVGSSPTRQVKTLCEYNGWSLHPDASNSTLNNLYRQATFTLLPFQYATGAKLKMLETLAYGVPFLATTHVRDQLESTPPLCLFSDNPADWLRHVDSTFRSGQTSEERIKLVNIAKSHSWEASAKNVFNILIRADYEKDTSAMHNPT